MKTQIIYGKDLTEKQINLIPKFNGLKQDRSGFLKRNKFHFSECGNFYSTNKNEYYPICFDFSNLEY